MPYMRKYKKRTYRKKGKKYYNRKKYNRMVKRNSGNQIVNARFRAENVLSSEIYNAAISGVGQSLSGHIAPSLSDFPGMIAYKNLFAQFRIKKIRVQFFPMVGRLVQSLADSITGNPTLTNQKPFFYTSVNRVSTSFPQDPEQILTTSSVKYGPMGRYYERYYSPTVFMELYRQQTITSAALSPAFNKWVSTNYADIAYHGLSWVVGPADGIPAQMYKYKTLITIYAQFKNRRVYTDNTDDGVADGTDNLHEDYQNYPSV